MNPARDSGLRNFRFASGSVSIGYTINAEARESIEAMSLGSAVFLTATLSTMIVSLLSCVKRPRGKFWFLVASLVVPFALANCFYWPQVEDRAALPDYWTWAPVFIIPCFLAGTVPSVAAVLLIRKSSAKAPVQRGTE
jgi:hypothetical protein